MFSLSLRLIFCSLFLLETDIENVSFVVSGAKLCIIRFPRVFSSEGLYLVESAVFTKF